MKKDSFASEFVQVSYHAGDVLFRYELMNNLLILGLLLPTLYAHWMIIGWLAMILMP